MSNLVAKILSSKFLNSGLIGKGKDYIYHHYVSDRMEAKTNAYRKEILDDFWEVFLDCDWLLASGSFLRYYRDQTMEGQDLDIHIRFDDFQVHKEQLIQKGYLLLAEYTDESGRINEYKLKYKKADIDIIFMHEDEEGWYYIGTYEDPEHKDSVKRDVVKNDRIVYGDGYCAYKKKLPDFEVAAYEFEHMKFKSYKNIDEHLTAEYGNWHVYDPAYDWLTCPADNLPEKVGKAKLVYHCEPYVTY